MDRESMRRLHGHQNVAERGDRGNLHPTEGVTLTL